MSALLMLLLFGQKYQVGECYSIDKVIISVKVTKVTDKDYEGNYWIPWLYKYVPKFNIPIERGHRMDVTKVECLKEKDKKVN